MSKEAKASFFIYKKEPAEEIRRYLLKVFVGTFTPACTVFLK